MLFSLLHFPFATSKHCCKPSLGSVEKCFAIHVFSSKLRLLQQPTTTVLLFFKLESTFFPFLISALIKFASWLLRIFFVFKSLLIHINSGFRSAKPILLVKRLYFCMTSCSQLRVDLYFRFNTCVVLRGYEFVLCQCDLE